MPEGSVVMVNTRSVFVFHSRGCETRELNVMPACRSVLRDLLRYPDPGSSFLNALTWVESSTQTPVAPLRLRSATDDGACPLLEAHILTELSSP